MTDPRNIVYTTYSQEDLVWLGILKNACDIESMQQMNENFNEYTCINTLSFLSGDSKLKEIPDFTTLNNYLEKLSPCCLSDIRKEMVKSLIRSKVFHNNRILGKYWPVVLDGTGLFHFKEKHCRNCLVRTVTDEEYPRLNICVQGDGLYGAEPLMRQCSGYGWKYLFTLNSTFPIN